MIRVQGLTVELGGQRILDRVSFDVAAGEAVALVGPNGSGKTTAFRCLLGLVPFAGSASVDELDVARDGIAVRRRIAYLPQRAAFGDVTAREALSLLAGLRGVPRARVADVLREVGLEPHADRRTRTFSGGMLQRMSLGAALLADAPVMILDEPTASLDRDAQETFVAMAARFKREGRTLLLSSHRPDEISGIADRLVALDRGRVLHVSAPARPVLLPLAVGAAGALA